MRSRGRAANEERKIQLRLRTTLSLLFSVIVFICIWGPSTRAQSVNNRPNVVFILIDDLGTGILFRTPFFKFSGAQESIYIFAKLGIGPWGRIGSGVVERQIGF